MKKLQINRLVKINELITLIANTDTRCFYYDNRISRFESHKKPYPISKARGFTDGGTLWSLIMDFKEWIITGKPSNGKHGHGGLYCTYWGYTIEGMETVITKAKEIGFLQESDPSFKEHCQTLLDIGYDYMLNKKMLYDLLELMNKV